MLTIAVHKRTQHTREKTRSGHSSDKEAPLAWDSPTQHTARTGTTGWQRTADLDLAWLWHTGTLLKSARSRPGEAWEEASGPPGVYLEFL